MSDCRYGVSPVNYPDPDPEDLEQEMRKTTVVSKIEVFGPTNPHLVEDVITRKSSINLAFVL